MRTFGDFDPFDGLVVDGSGALLDELVALDAEVEDLGTLDRHLDELLHDIMHDIRCDLELRFASPKAKARMHPRP